MKSFSLILTVLALSSAAHANPQDLTNDLKTPFQQLSNPFDGTAEVKLDPALASAVNDLITECAVTPVSLRKDGSVAEQDPSRVRKASAPTCASRLQLSNAGSASDYEQDNKLVMTLGDDKHTVLTAIAWDGSDSDGGDEQAIGIYDAQGNRVAVFPGEHVIGNVIDGVGYTQGLLLQILDKADSGWKNQ